MGYIIYIDIYQYILYKILSGFFRHFNFCSTVICSLFCCSGKFFPVPLFSGTFISVPLLSVPLFRVPKTDHKENYVCFEKHPWFWAGKFAPAP